MKKVLCVLLSTCILFMCFFSLSSYASDDITKPIIDIESFTVSNSNPATGEKIEVSVIAADNVAIKKVVAAYITPITRKTEIFTLEYNADKKCFVGVIATNDSMEAGTWVLDYIWASDTSSNVTYAYSKDGIGSFTLSKTAADATKPEIDVSSLTVSNSTPSVGETIDIFVKVTDNKKVKSVSVVYFSPITSKVENIILKESSDDIYVGKLTIVDSMEAGTWVANYIWASDEATNVTYVYPKNNEGSFTLSGTNADVTKPIIDIESLTVSNSNPNFGETIDVSVKVIDNERVKNVTLAYCSPVSGKIKNILLKKSLDDIYVGQITIDENTESGTWIVYYVWASDVSSNVTYSYPKDSKGSFVVRGTTTDITKPEIDIDSLTVSNSKPVVGDTIDISVKVTDNEKIKSVMALYISPITNKPESIFLEHTTGDMYVGHLKIAESMEAGTWTICYVWASDISSNITYAYPNEDDGSFLLSGTTADMMNPIIDSDSLMISNSNPHIGEIIEISVKVSDNKQVKDVVVTYNSPSMNSSEQITMMFDSSKNSYIGYLTVKENMEFGKWSVSYIWASDEASNIAYAYPENGCFELSEKSIILGDINFDGTINSSDALAVLQHSVGQIKLNDRKFVAGDVNKNNAINSSDALLILQYSVGQISEF